MKKIILPVFLACATLTAHAQTPAPASSPAALKPLPINGFVTLDEIVSDFRNAPDLAQQKYGGQEIIVYGRVGQITNPSDSDGVLAVLMQQFNNPTPEVRAIFDMDDMPPQSSVEISSDGSQAVVSHRTRRTDEINASRPFVSVDERVGIRGDFSNFNAGDIILKNCRKISKERLEQIMQAAGAAQ